MTEGRKYHLLIEEKMQPSRLPGPAREGFLDRITELQDYFDSQKGILADAIRSYPQNVSGGRIPFSALTQGWQSVLLP